MPHWHHVPRVDELGALDVGGLLQRVELECAFGFLADAIERRGADADRGGLALHLPVGGGHAGFQCGVAEVDGMAVTTGFTGGIGDVRVDSVTEGRLILDRDAEVRFGDEIHIKRAIGLCGSGAVGDFLTLALRHRAPPIVPAPPSGITHFTDDAPFHFSIVNGSAGVAGSLADESDLATEFTGGFRCFKFHLEFRPFVFLHVDGGIAAWAGGDL